MRDLLKSCKLTYLLLFLIEMSAKIGLLRFCLTRIICLFLLFITSIGNAHFIVIIRYFIGWSYKIMWKKDCTNFSEVSSDSRLHRAWNFFSLIFVQYFTSKKSWNLADPSCPIRFFQSLFRHSNVIICLEMGTVEWWRKWSWRMFEFRMVISGWE